MLVQRIRLFGGHNVPFCTFNSQIQFAIRTEVPYPRNIREIFCLFQKFLHRKCRVRIARFYIL